MLTSLPLRFSQTGTLLFVTIIALLAHFVFAEQAVHFLFEQSALAAGQWYRLLSYAFYHTNSYHLALNLAGMWLLWLLHGEYYDTVTTTAVLLWCIVSSALAVWFFAPDIDYYMGLSAALHGLFVWGACRDIALKHYSGWMLLIGITIKLFIEQTEDDDTTAALIEANVAHMGHVYGALSGLLYWVGAWCLMKVWQRVITTKPQ
jgi:rhomboid family GlyGly-CTERM serine protease